MVECLTPDEGLRVRALSSADFFFKIYPSKNCFRSTIRVSYSLDPDQDLQNVPPNLAKVISRQQKSPLAQHNSSEDGCRISTKLY